MKIIVSLFFVLIMFSLSLAQNPVKFGFKLGINSSKLKEKPKNNNIYNEQFFPLERISPQIGLFIQVLDFKYANLEVDLFYLQKGGDNKYEVKTPTEPDGTGEIINYDQQFDLFQVNLNIRPKYELPKYTIFGICGFYSSYLVISKGPLSRDLSDLILGYRAGFGIGIKNFLDNTFNIEFVYEEDITKIIEYSYVDIWTRSFQITFGIVIL